MSLSNKDRANTELLQTPDSDALDSDPVTTLTKLKAVYDSLNDKRSESGPLAKRNFWDWLKDMFTAPGLKARSLDVNSLIENDADAASKTKRTCATVSESEGPILPREDSHTQDLRRDADGRWEFLTRRCDVKIEGGS